MYVCVKCRKEMRCAKNGLGARFGMYHVYPGDMFKCPKCGIKIVAAVVGTTNDKDESIETISMDEGNSQ